jgi:negative regulator of sigma E activity
MTPNWLNRILGHQVAPPEQAWVNIANELDKEDKHIAEALKTKMLSHETMPPVATLANIFDALDKEDAQSAAGYIERIKNHTEQAPVAAWNNIVTALDKEKAKVVPIRSSGKNLRAIYIRVAAAAAVIAIVLLAIFPLTKKAEPGKENLTSTNAATEQNTPTNKATTPIIAVTKKAAPVNTGIANNKTKAPSIQQPVYSFIQNYIKGNEVVDLAQNPTGSNTEKLQNSKGEIPMDIALMNTPNTYISITGADGQTVKVSSKFSNLINYLALVNPDTQETIDVIIEESAKWRKTFAEWRDKMTNNTVAPSLSNFMDIIELSKMLEEKNK